MTRFVRIIPDPDPRADPGSRIRVDYDPDDTGAFCISDENVLPEKLRDPDCYHVRTIANIEMDRTKARAIRDAMVELCNNLDEEDRAAKELDARAVVAAAHGVPLSAVQVVTAEPELSERARAEFAAHATREVDRTTLDAAGRCPHGNMPRESGAGHWRDWHRGHGCHLDPDAKPVKGAP